MNITNSNNSSTKNGSSHSGAMYVMHTSASFRARESPRGPEWSVTCLGRVPAARLISTSAYKTNNNKGSNNSNTY